MAQAGALFYDLIPKLDTSALSAAAREAGAMAGAPMGTRMGEEAGRSAGPALAQSGRSMEQAASDMGTRVGTALGRPLGNALMPVGDAISWAQGQFQRLPPVVGETLGRVPSLASDMATRMGGFINDGTAHAATLFEGMGGKIKASATSAFDHVKNAASTAFAPVSSILNNFGISTGMAFGAVAAGAVLVGVHFDQMKDKAILSFTTLLGSGQKAQDMFQSLSDFTAKTPFELPGVVDAAKKMLAMGFSAKDVVPNLTAVGDAAATMGGGVDMVNSVMSVMGIAMEKGTFTGKQVTTMMKDGIPVYAILANSMGISEKAVSDMVKKGLLPASEAIPILMKGIETGTDGAAGHTVAMAGMMERQSHTMEGTWTRFKEKFAEIMGGLMTGVGPAIAGGLDLLSGAFDKLPGVVGFVKDRFGELWAASQPLVKVLQDLWTSIAPTLVPILKVLAEIVGGALVLAWRGLLIGIGLVADVLRGLGAAIGGVTQFFRDNQAVAMVVGAGLLILVGTTIAYNAALIIGTINLGIHTALHFVAATATGVLTGVTWLLNAALNANPLALIIIIVVAFVAAIVYAYTHIGWFKDIVDAAWTVIKTAFQVGWDIVKNVFAWIVAAAINVGSWFATVWNGVATAFTTVWNAIAGFLTGVWNGIIAVATTVFGAIGAFFSGIWNGVSAVFTTVWNGIRDFAIAVWTAIGAWFEERWRIASGNWAALWTNVSTFFIGIWNAISAFVVSIWTTISGYFTTAFNAYVALFTSIWTRVSNFFSTIWNAIWAFVQMIWNTIVSWWTAAYNAYVAMFTAIWTNVSNFFSGIWNAIWAFVQMIWNTISGWFTTAFNAYYAAFSAIWTNVSNFFSGIWNGIWAFVQSIWGTISRFFTDAFNTFRTIFTDTWNGIVRIFTDIWNGIVRIASDVWDKVKQGFKDGINGIIDVINVFAGAINFVAGLLGFTINLHVNKLSGGGQIEEIRRSLGGTIELKQVIRRADGGAVSGQLPGYSPGVDTLPAMTRGGVPYLLAGGEFIVRPEATRAIGFAGMQAINNAHREPVDLRYLTLGGPIGLALGGETLGQMDSIRAQMFPGSVMTSGYRPGDPGYHGRRQAIDIGWPGNNQAHLDAIGAALVNKYGASSSEIIHNPNASVLNERNVSPGVWGAQTWADHVSHVHWATTPAEMNRIGGGTGFGNPGNLVDNVASAIAAAAHLALDPLRSAMHALSGTDAPLPMKFAVGLGDKLLDGIFGSAEAKDAAANAAMAASGGGGGGPAPAGQVNDWIMSALGLLAYPGFYASGLYQQVMTESGGNPKAINNWDSNAKAGHPSKGIMQVIDSTFLANMVGGHGDIWNPVDNIAAGAHYAMGRYGPGWFSPGPQHTHGYDQGGMLPMGTSLVYNGTGRPEGVLTGEQLDRLTGAANRGGGGDGALIGSLNLSVPDGASARDVVDELSFALRHTQRGIHARGNRP